MHSRAFMGWVGFAASIAWAAASAAPLTLVENGMPAATLILAPEPTQTAAFAAQELRLHVREITGVELPVASTANTAVGGTRILVGESAFTREVGFASADFAGQEYLIGFRPNTLILMGNDRDRPVPSPVTVHGRPQSVVGRFGRALHFEGQAGLRVSSPGFSDAAGTMACWVRLPGDVPPQGGAATILRLDGQSPWTYHIVEAGHGSRRIKYVTYDGKAGSSVLSGELSAGWHHLAATHSEAERRIELFVDGESQGTAPFTRSTCARAALQIGGIVSSAPNKPVGNPLIGAVDDVWISRAVRPVVQGRLMKAAVSDADTRLLLSFDEEGTVPRDSSGRLRAAPLPGAYDAQGTCYAVYDFLERHCGVRWFAPGDIGRVCPKSPTLRVKGQDVRRAPRFVFRQGTYLPVYGMLKAVWDNPSRHDVRLYACRMRLGGQPYAANHSFYGYYDRFYARNPKHPERFEGERRDWFAQGYAGSPPQMCFTNPGFIKQVVQDAREYFDGKGAKPGAQANGDFFALVPMDNGSWCKCPACQAEMNEGQRENRHFSKGLASDYVFGFANKVAKEIRKTHPDKYLATLSYASYAYYPQRIRLESNIAVQLCLHVRNWWAPAMERNDMAFYRSWVDKEKDRPIYLWLYYCFPEEIAMKRGWHCFPGFFAHTIDRQFKMFARDGIRGAFLNNLGDYLDTYITFRFLDDPEQSVDRIIDEFHTLYYGAAAEPMKTLYLRIEEIYSNPANYAEDIRNGTRHTHQTEEIAWGSLGTAERMEELGLYMARAKALARTEAEKLRVRLFEEGIWQYMLEGRRNRAEREALRPEVEKLRAAGPASAVVPQLPEAVEDVQQVDWSTAVHLRDWRRIDGYPTSRRPEAWLVHDGQCLYVRFAEPVQPSGLVNDPGIWAGDDWELFFARHRAKPYRQIGINPKGTFKDFGLGDGKPMSSSGARVTSDTTRADRWVVTVVLPLSRLLPGGVSSGDIFFAGFFRATGGTPRELLGWTPTFSGRFHAPERFGQLRLE